jgi:hypothetical protein
MLLDILQPMTVTDDQMGLLVYTFYETSGRGIIEFVRPPDVMQMALNPDHTRLMVRRASGLQPIEVYNLDTGVLEKTYFPAERDDSGGHVLSYNASGDQVISDFERFDAQSGCARQRRAGYERLRALLLHQDNRNGDDYRFDWRLWIRDRTDFAAGDLAG